MTAGEVDLPFSPLLERELLRAVPGALSLSRYSPCNGASVLNAGPLSIKMPGERWAYGVLFPFDREALVCKPGALYVARIKLVVDGGPVGVAACNADGSLFTTPETVASGTSEVRLTLTRPADAGAIVVREVVGGKNVRATILDIGLFEAGEERLAPRQHDLGYDLFVILAPPKTGTHTVVNALYSLSPLVRIRRLHHASAAYCQKLWAGARDGAAILGAEHPLVLARKAQAEAGDQARADISTVRQQGGSVAFITAVREPIARAVANMFETLPSAIPVYSQLYAIGGSVFAQMLADGLIATWDLELRKELGPLVQDLWPRFNRDADHVSDEFRSVSGFDLLCHGFNARQGYACLKHGCDAAVLFRTSEMARTLASGLTDLTGRAPESFSNRNVAAEKEYARLYGDVVSRLRVPTELAGAIYRRHAYMTRLFDQAEIDDLVLRWSGSQAQKTT